MSGEPRYCSWAPDVLLRRPSVRRMGAEAFGGYCSLLLEAWLDPSGSLPNSQSELASLSRLEERYPVYESLLLSLFIVEGDRIVSEEIREVRERAESRSRQAKEAVAIREQRRADRPIIDRSSTDVSEDKPTDHRPIIDRSSKVKVKVKEKVKEKVNPIKGSKKALSTGDPRNAETWEAFNSAYPRPSNGRKLEIAQARLTFDTLIEGGVDPLTIVDGARRYAEWVLLTDGGKFVAMMTTWLNQRRWEESYVIEPNSEEGKEIAKRKAAAIAARRAEHKAKFFDIYLSTVRNRAYEGAAKDLASIEAWEVSLRASIERRKNRGLEAAARASEALLTDPEARKKAITDAYLERYPAPDFWEWDREENPEGLK